MKKIALVTMVVFLCGCGIKPDINPFDKKPDWPESIHSGHVEIVGKWPHCQYKTDDGVIHGISFTAGTDPCFGWTQSEYNVKRTGTITVKVPSYGSSGFTYYFMSYKPD